METTMANFTVSLPPRDSEYMVLWPKVFTDPAYEYTGTEHEIQAAAIADGLIGWATCALEHPPAEFGRGMAKVGIAAGVTGCEDALMARGRELGLMASSDKECA